MSITSLSSEFSAVSLLGNRYGMVHQKPSPSGTPLIVIIVHLETDIEVARLAAQSFASEHRIVYRHALYNIGQLVTVIKNQEQWFPAVVSSGRVDLVDTVEFADGERFLGGTRESAINTAGAIAEYGKVSLVPLLGIDFSPPEVTESTLSVRHLLTRDLFL